MNTRLSRRAFSLALAGTSAFAQNATKQAQTGEEWRAMNHGGLVPESPANAEAVARARASIPKLRMREVEILAVDETGLPIRHLPVELIQLRQAFPFGDQMWELDRMFRFHEQDTDRAKYWKLRHSELFNSATALCYWTERPRNDAPKTEDLQGDLRLDGFEYCVNWARSQGLTVKGHPLFWSIPKGIPEWLKRYDYATQLKFVEVRVRDLVARFKGRVSIWDAVNESLWEPALRDLPKRHWPHIEPVAQIAEYVGRVLGWAREEDPDATYILNDYGMEQDPENGPPVTSDGVRVTAKMQRQRMLQVLKELKTRGTPPSAIGLQSHTGGWLAPATQMSVYDELSQAGIPIHITEFWAHPSELDTKIPREDAERLVADYTTNVLTCAFGHPAVHAFFFWGFGGIKWGEFSSNQVTSVYTRIQELLHKQWMTRVKMQTDSDGRIRCRAFCGDYTMRYPLSPTNASGVPFRVDRAHTGTLRLTAPFAKRS